MFDRNWFSQHQKILLRLVNTPIIQLWFRWLLRINGKRSSVAKRKIVRILPNSITWVENKKISIEFRTHDKFAKRLYYGLLPLWYVIHFWDTVFANNWKPDWNLGFDTTGNLFPAAGANSPVDGYVGRQNAVNETFTNIRSGVGDAASVTDVSGGVPQLVASTTSNQYDQLYRGIDCFDTSVIGAGKTIDTVVLSLFGTAAITTGLGSPDFHISGATPANTNNLVSGDYSQLQTTSFGNIANASWSATAYNDFTLNQSGKDNIATGGISKFGEQLSWDINNNFTGVWASGTGSRFHHAFADTAGTANDPKLVVTFSLPGGTVEDAYFM